MTCRVDGWAQPVPAIAYTDLVDELAPGDAVLLNTRALSLGLGTGGLAFVVARADAGRDGLVGGPAGPPGPGGPERGEPDDDSGYLVKARYTPLQVVRRGVDSQHSPHHDTMAAARSLGGLPVVVADLHSSLPAICAGLLSERPEARLVYVMSDGAALPLALSRLAARLRLEGTLAACITAGQAFGGDFEAVSVHSALLAARHVVEADAAIVIQGPGNLGTDTPWGFSGLAAGEAINAAGVLGGRPVACLRVSGADGRARHRGLSHHSLTAYGKVALRPADVVVPVMVGALAELSAQVAAEARVLGPPWGIHRLVRVATDGLLSVLEGVPGLSTMGRSLADDPGAFLAAAAAGRHAAALLG
jgi:hypothetical protein